MSNAWNYLKPRDKFSVTKNQYISEIDHLVLNMLYQPIVGVEAIGLLNLLLVENKFNFKKQMQLHSILLNQLNIGIPEFYKAREKLEALGLLKTFMKKLDYENHFIYEIQQPLSPSKFLHDDILSLLLIDKLGFEKVTEISDFFNYNHKEMSDYLDVTKPFLDVFQFESNRLANKEEELNKVKEIVTPSVLEKQDIVIKETFDWAFFMSLVSSLHINQKQIKNELKKTIELFHQLYGINELEMLDYVKQAIDYVSNHINEKEFKQLIYKGYHSQRKQEKAKQVATNEKKETLTDTEKTQLRRNTLQLTGFNEGEINVILSCETIPPLVFLKALKQQKGGFVSSNERWTVENLKKQSRLPDSVINVLIHYVLIAQGNSSLNQNFITSIANDWAQKKIFSPEEAFNQVKKVKDTTKKNQNRQQNNYPKKARKETLPDWAKQEKKRKETPLSEQEKKQLKDQLQRLNQK